MAPILRVRTCRVLTSSRRSCLKRFWLIPTCAMRAAWSAVINQGRVSWTTERRREQEAGNPRSLCRGGETTRFSDCRGKPGDPSRRPPQIAPYHLRLDWLMWFAAMSRYNEEPWFHKRTRASSTESRSPMRRIVPSGSERAGHPIRESVEFSLKRTKADAFDFAIRSQTDSAFNETVLELHFVYIEASRADAFEDRRLHRSELQGG
jgi:hypothetical protein